MNPSELLSLIRETDPAFYAYLANHIREHLDALLSFLLSEKGAAERARVPERLLVDQSKGGMSLEEKTIWCLEGFIAETGCTTVNALAIRTGYKAPITTILDLPEDGPIHTFILRRVHVAEPPRELNVFDILGGGLVRKRQ